MAKRRRRRRLEGKYVARRLVLVVLAVAVVIALLWWLLPIGGKEEGDADVDGTPEPDPAAATQQPEESAPPAVIDPPPAAPEATPVSRDDWNLILVNSGNPLPDDFSVELEQVYESYQVDTRIADNVRRMFLAARESGIELMVCSAHRTPEKQQVNFENQKQSYIAQGMSEEDAEAATAAYIAYPGTSEHHTGLAVDIVTPDYQNLDDGFADTPAFGWLSENAHKFGFILRYPRNKEAVTGISYEPWHYRYVGEDHAAIIKEDGYCLEEYLDVGLNRGLRAEEMDEEPEDGEGEGEEDEPTPGE